MKRFNALSAALGLVAALASSPALALAKPLFSFEFQGIGSPPGFGTSIGTVAVDDGSFTGLPPLPPSTRQLLIDSQGVGSYGDILGIFAISVPGSFSMSAFQYSFSVATATSFQFNYNFLTNTDPNDLSTFELFTADLFDAGLADIGNLAFEATGISTFVPSASFYAQETGTKFVEFAVGPGSYTAQFLLVSGQAACIGGQPGCIPTAVVINAVPEPTTLALVALALVAAAVPRRRR